MKEKEDQEEMINERNTKNGKRKGNKNMKKLREKGIAGKQKKNRGKVMKKRERTGRNKFKNRKQEKN